MKVRTRAQTIGTFRFVSVFLMDLLASWTPTTPEMEVKTLFGRHIWLLAQHADALGHRTHELRATLHYSRRPLPAFEAALQRLRAVTATEDRLSAFYDVALDVLAAAYTAYCEQNDPLLDEPSFVILDAMQQSIGRMRRERDALCRQFPQLARADALSALRCAFAAAGEMTNPSEDLQQVG